MISILFIGIADTFDCFVICHLLQLFATEKEDFVLQGAQKAILKYSLSYKVIASLTRENISVFALFCSSKRTFSPK